MLDFHNKTPKLSMDDRGFKIILMLIFVVGLMGSASIISEAIGGPKKGERFVSVRGVTEKEVQADLAVWPVRILAVGADLSDAERNLKRVREKILAFFADKQIKKEEISIQGMRIVKAKAQAAGAHSYQIEQTLLVQSTEVAKVEKLSQMTRALASVGVVPDANGCVTPQYLYTRLTAIKPEMIASAQEAAYVLAKQFENEKDAHLGPLRHAEQGVFTLSDKHEKMAGLNKPACTSSTNKIVRLEMAVDYYLH